MGKDAVEGNLIQKLRNMERRIAALERQEQQVGQLSELSRDLGDVTFGEGNGRLYPDGITVLGDATGVPNAYRIVDADGNTIGEFRGYDSGDTFITEILGKEKASRVTEVQITANGIGHSSGTNDSSVTITAHDDVNTRLIRIYSTVTQAYFEDLGILVNSNSADADSVIKGTGGAVLTVDAGNNDVTIPTKLNMGSVGVLTGGSAPIPDDAATSFTPATAQGTMLFNLGAVYPNGYGILIYNTAAPNAYLMVAGSVVAVTTGVLSGTTGVDGKLTVSCHTDGKIYIENRLGGSRTVKYQIMAGA